MTYIICALKIEASPIINHYKLQKIDSKRYKNQKIILLICGVGEENALNVVLHIKQNYKIKKDDVLINFGICGCISREFKIGDIFFINQLNVKQESFEIKNDEILKNNSLSSFNKAINSFHSFDIKTTLVDMEAGFIYKEAKYIFNNIYILKIVSDYLDTNLPEKNFIYQITNKNIKCLEKFIDK